VVGGPTRFSAVFCFAWLVRWPSMICRDRDTQAARGRGQSKRLFTLATRGRGDHQIARSVSAARSCHFRVERCLIAGIARGAGILARSTDGRTDSLGAYVRWGERPSESAQGAGCTRHLGIAVTRDVMFGGVAPVAERRVSGGLGLYCHEG